MTAKPVPEHISDELTALERLRLHVHNHETFPFSPEDAEEILEEYEVALTELQHRRGAEAGGWSRSEAPLERFVLVRPIGLHHSGEPFTPTDAQCLDWSGTRRWYTPMNEIEPIEFGESIEQDGLPDNLRFHGTEWRYLPDDPALAASPSSPASNHWGEPGVDLDIGRYERVHEAAIAAYELHVPKDYRYSATALRHAVDAAIRSALGEHP